MQVNAVTVGEKEVNAYLAKGIFRTCLFILFVLGSYTNLSLCLMLLRFMLMCL